MPRPSPLSFLTRKPGPMTVLDVAALTLLRRWVPKWHEVFFDPATPLFYERVGPAFRPLHTGQRRLLTQLRQMAMYAHATVQPETFLFRPDLRAHAQAVFSLYRGPQPGAWIYALDDDLRPADTTQDLYTHAFVIFALAHYGRATDDPQARALALATAQYIDTAFRRGVEDGFAEALNADGVPDMARPRRHESHMHLLEACLFAAAQWNEPIFMRLADDITGLFLRRLYDARHNILSEYFTAELQPAPDAASGRIVCEAGHYFEWIWLLKKHAAASGAPRMHDAVCLQLLAWANAHGWDHDFGGIYDEVDPHGGIISERKRIWPLTEGLKANALLLDIAPDRDGIKDRMAAMATLLRGAYIQERGFWSEWLTRDLQPAVDYMPATTPYHVYFGIMEARAALRARGASKSWRAAPYLILYGTMRRLSVLARAVRSAFGGK